MTTTDSMHLTVNGEKLELDAAETTVSQLLERVGLAGKAVAVEVNRAIVPKAKHESHVLREGDTIELVTLVGGG